MTPEDVSWPLDECEPVHGVVVLLDALGAKIFSRSDIRSFLEAHHFVLRILDEVLPALDARRSVLAGTRSATIPKVLVFGDTIALLWPLASDDYRSSLRELQELSAAAAYVVAIAFIAGLYLRGAIAVGEFYMESNIVLGPAVADAATWYEQPQFVGVVATPTTRQVLLEALSEEPLSASPPVAPPRTIEDGLRAVLVELTQLFWPAYALPMKDGTVSAQSCLNWPYAMFMLGPEITQRTGEHVTAFFRRKLHSRPRPPGAQAKYDNTERFFDYCATAIAAAEERSAHIALVRAYNTDQPVAWLPSFLDKYR